MKRTVALLMLVLLGAVPVVAESVAQIGVRFANSFAAYAPLGLFHRSYSDFLFLGTPVVVPTGSASACELTALQLAELHLALLTQTSSSLGLTMPMIAGLRAEMAGFCASWLPTLERLEYEHPMDEALLAEASEDGLFVEIKTLQDRMQHLLDAFLEGIDEDELLWAFGVAFSMRSILLQERVDQIDASVQDILYGSSEAIAPPAFVPTDISSTIQALVSLQGRALSDEESEQAANLAQTLFSYVMDED